jgi:hypothetical protein
MMYQLTTVAKPHLAASATDGGRGPSVPLHVLLGLLDLTNPRLHHRTVHQDDDAQKWRFLADCHRIAKLNDIKPV